MRLRELARRIGARMGAEGEDREVRALAAPAVATPHEVSFSPPGADAGGATRAAAVLIAPGSISMAGAVRIETDDLLMSLCRAAAWLPVRRGAAPRALTGERVHPSARIAPGAHVAPGATLGEGCVVEPGAVLGEEVVIGSFSLVGGGAQIIGPVSIGNRCRIGPGTTIGGDGFGFVRDQQRWHAIPCFGGVRIGDDVVILAQSTVHAGIFTDTIVGERCVLDSQVLIGHDARLGADCALAGQTAVAGSVRIGRRCRIGGRVGIAEGVRIAEGVTVTGMSMVSRSIDEPGARYSSGWPAEPSRSWWRRVARMRRITGFNGRGRDGAAPVEGSGPVDGKARESTSE